MTAPPDDVDEGLTTLRDTGNAVIKGVVFDLTHDKLCDGDWTPEECLGFRSSELSEPIFPWGQPDPNYGDAARLVDVQRGDHISIADAVPSEGGSAVDHPKDRDFRICRILLQRAEKNSTLFERVTFKSNDSFVSERDVNIEGIIQRVCELMGLSDLYDDFDYDEFQEGLAGRIMPAGNQLAQQVLSSAQNADTAQSEILIAILNGDDPSYWNFDGSESLYEYVAPILERLIDHAAAAGYWQAKSEFAAHVPDAIEAKRLARIAKSSGNKGVEVKKIKTDKWTKPFLTFVKKTRGAHKELGQKTIAKRAKDDHVLGASCKLPSLERLIAKIREWEEDETVDRGTNNPKHPLRTARKTKRGDK